MRGDKIHKVTTLDPFKGAVQCNECRSAWAYGLWPGGRRPVRWWLCPQGCNALKKPEEKRGAA